MSYANIRVRNQEAATPPVNPTKCFADHCPCRGSISWDGGKFMCPAHAFSPSEGWPRITEKLHEHSWLIAFMDDIQRIDSVRDSKASNWREYATAFWTGQDDYCLPDAKEEAAMYLYRMREELQYRCGLTRRPTVRIPEPVKSRGNAAFAWRKAA